MAPDHEMPESVARSNIYTVTVTATDGTFTTSQTFAITVTDVNDNAPVFTSSATAIYAENATTTVTTVTATDADADGGQAVSFTLTGGADMSLFSLSSTGELTFNTAPDYENPSGTGGDNDYEVIVTASDDARLPLPSGLMGSMTTTQTLTITVTDVNDNAPIFSSSATANVAEGTTAVITVTATDADEDAGQTVSYTLTGGSGCL